MSFRREETLWLGRQRLRPWEAARKQKEDPFHSSFMKGWTNPQVTIKKAQRRQQSETTGGNP